MAVVRGILVKQFGGPEVLEYVETLSRPSEPVGKQVLLVLIIHPVLYCLNVYIYLIIIVIDVMQ